MAPMVTVVLRAGSALLRTRRRHTRRHPGKIRLESCGRPVSSATELSGHLGHVHGNRVAAKPGSHRPRPPPARLVVVDRHERNALPERLTDLTVVDRAVQDGDNLARDLPWLRMRDDPLHLAFLGAQDGHTFKWRRRWRHVRSP